MNLTSRLTLTTAHDDNLALSFDRIYVQGRVSRVERCMQRPSSLRSKLLRMHKRTVVTSREGGRAIMRADAKQIGSCCQRGVQR